MTILPATLQNIIASVVGASDLTDSAAVTSRCEDWSRALVMALRGVSDDDGEPVRAWSGLRWPDGAVPEAVAGDELALGHVVAWVEWCGDTYRIDLTAAQFQQLGWTGPRAVRL